MWYAGSVLRIVIQIISGLEEPSPSPSVFLVEAGETLPPPETILQFV